MWILEFFHHLNIIELDVEILIDRFERAADRDIVLQFHRHFVVDQGLEKTVRPRSASSLIMCLLACYYLPSLSVFFHSLT